MFERLRDTKGVYKNKVDGLARIVKAKRDELKKAKKKPANTPGVPVKDVFSDCPCDSGLVFPASYTVKDEGIFFESVKVIACPIIITYRGRNIKTSYEVVKLAWKRAEVWQIATFPRHYITNQRYLDHFTKHAGFPADSNNIRAVIQFLSAFYDVNTNNISYAIVTPSMGYIEEYKGFMYGTTFIQQPGAPKVELELELPDAGNVQIAGAYRVRGTYEDQRAMWALLAPYPRMKFCLPAACSSILNDIIFHDFPHVINFHGFTTTQKTMRLYLMASVHGEPKKLVTTFDDTRVAFERSANMQNGLPMFVDEDETKNVGKYTNDAIQKQIYAWCSGHGRGRGTTIPGGLEAKSTLRTTFFTTSESAITEKTGQGGVTSRILSMGGAGLSTNLAVTNAPSMPELIEKIKSGILEHYGHIGKRFVEYILNNMDKAKAWRTRRMEIAKDSLSGRDEAQLYRIAECFAIHALTSEIMQEAGLLPWEHNAEEFKGLFDLILSDVVEMDIYARLFVKLYQYCETNIVNFDQRFKMIVRGDNPPEPIIPSKIYGSWPINGGSVDSPNCDVGPVYIFSEVVRNFLEKVCLHRNYNEVLRTWKTKGWIRTDKTGCTVKTPTMQQCINEFGKSQRRGICLTYDTIAHLVFHDNPPEYDNDVPDGFELYDNGRLELAGAY